MRQEHHFVRDLLRLLRDEIEDRGVVLKHSDYALSGVPDITITWNGRTSWWEAKHATPRIQGTGLQHLTARRLAAAGHCWYIVYETHSANGDRTCLVRPEHVGENGYFRPDAFHTGIDHAFILDFIRRVHHA